MAQHGYPSDEEVLAYYPRLSEILMTSDEVRARVWELANEILERNPNTTVNNPLLVVCVLKGAFPFFAMLTEAFGRLGLSHIVDFIDVGSYGKERKSSNSVRVYKDMQKDVMERDVLLVEDLIDTGLTLSFVQDLILNRRPQSLQTCVLLDKPESRQHEAKVDYVGRAIDGHFVVGVGLDDVHRNRGLPFIAVMHDEEYIRENKLLYPEEEA